MNSSSPEPTDLPDLASTHTGTSSLAVNSNAKESSPMPILKLTDIRRDFHMGEVTVSVLHGLDLTVYEGEILVIVGPSGSGKTTILNLIGGLDTPTGGTITYRGDSISDFDKRKQTAYRRNEIGFVFQFYNLAPNLTAKENVLVTTEISKNPIDADDVLEMVDLSDRAEHFPSQLSGGEQQRVAIARAIAKNPDLLLCDEPTGALDFETGKKVLRLLVDLNRDLGKTILMITHNAALAAIADRVVHIRSGEITEIEINASPIPPEEVTW
ncbi:MAG: ABC transporter ATP-binding protein [Pirellulaceae bacterium]|nr:ABC transporter ATP-binding protein [Pirellulaceae bacterium]